MEVLVEGEPDRAKAMPVNGMAGSLQMVREERGEGGVRDLIGLGEERCPGR
jgi:hypothetical protein